MSFSFSSAEADYLICPELFSPSQDDTFTEVIDGDKKVYQCLLPDCGKTFRFKSEMKRHQATHSDDRPFKCPYDDCRKGFKRPDALKNHLRTHTNTLRYFCDEPGCGSQFVNRAALKYHLLKHKDNKVYKCSHPGCNKAFVSMNQLKQHEKAVKYHSWIEKANSQLIKIKAERCDDGSEENLSMADTASTGDDYSPKSFTKFEYIETSLKNVKFEEATEEAPDMYAYLENLYGRKKLHVEEVCYTQGEYCHFVNFAEFNDVQADGQAEPERENTKAIRTISIISFKAPIDFDDLENFFDSHSLPVFAFDQENVDTFFDF